MSAFLIGYRGCGKTTIGAKLADRLWQSFIDSDERVVAKAGKTIKEIFERDGEPAFRDLESAVVAELAKLDEHVIALGGGAVLRDENVRHLRNERHRVVYLRCEPDELLRRIQTDPETAATRPNLTALGGIEEVKALVAQREPIYRAAMTSELDVTHLTPEEAVKYIARMI
jgi:shikimate kinase